MTVAKENMCCGCYLCKDICPVDAITLRTTAENYNAEIDETLCVKCGRCSTLCPAENMPSLDSPKKWYQGWAEDEVLRAGSTSGGVAAALSRSIVAQSGIVCSCVCKDGEFVFDFIEVEEELHRFSGSKYVKSNPSGVYKRIKRELSGGRKLLFIGLPCQVAALKNYMGADIPENLYTVDLICHGTPAPEMLDSFLKGRGFGKKDLDSLRFRTNNEYNIKIDGKPAEFGYRDKYTYAFLQGLIFTENCYKCPYAKGSRASDITLGDCWGSDLPEVQREKGISLILCQTDKGIELLKNSDIHLKDVGFNKAIAGNGQLSKPTSKPRCRDKFFKIYKKTGSFGIAAFMCDPKYFTWSKLKGGRQ